MEHSIEHSIEHLIEHSIEPALGRASAPHLLVPPHATFDGTVDAMEHSMEHSIEPVSGRADRPYFPVPRWRESRLGRAALHAPCLSPVCASIYMYERSAHPVLDRIFSRLGIQSNVSDRMFHRSDQSVCSIECPVLSVW